MVWKKYASRPFNHCTSNVSLLIQNIQRVIEQFSQLAHLGNIKPSTLRQVEDATLRMLVNVADGNTAQEELPTFLQEFNDMTSVWDREERSPDDYRFTSPLVY